MKKLFAILLAVMMILSLAACSPKENEKADKSTTAATETAQDETEAAEDTDDAAEEEAKTAEKSDEQKNTSAAKQYDTLKDYYNDPENIKGLDELKKSGEGVMEIDAYVEDGTLVYDYTYIDQIDESKLASVKETLDQAIEASADTFTNLKKQMQDQVKEEIGIKIIYRNADDSVITEKEF